MIYSYSRLKCYADCPASFQYKYLFEIPDHPTEALILGKTVHAAIQQILNGMDINAAIDRAMQEAELPIDRYEVEKLTQHSAVSEVFGGNVEQHLTTPLDDDGSIQFQGYIDWWSRLQDGSIHLIDWKTNRQQYHPKDNHQLGLYTWYLRQVTDVKEINAELVFLRFNRETCRQSHSYTLHETEQARQWALGLAIEIEDKVAEWSLQNDGLDTDLFPAKPGVHCQHCSYASLCIESAQIRPLEVNDRADAKKVAAEIIRLEAALGDMKDKLKAWVKTNGDVSIADAAFSFVPSVSWNIEAEKLYELCAELHDSGVDVFQYLTLTAANLKKIGVSDDRLATFGKKKITKTFRLVKTKEAC